MRERVLATGVTEGRQSNDRKVHLTIVTLNNKYPKH